MNGQTFRRAAEVPVPVMVCMDGFIPSHAVQRLNIPDLKPRLTPVR